VHERNLAQTLNPQRQALNPKQEVSNYSKQEFSICSKHALAGNKNQELGFEHRRRETTKQQKGTNLSIDDAKQRSNKKARPQQEKQFDGCRVDMFAQPSGIVQTNLTLILVKPPPQPLNTRHLGSHGVNVNHHRKLVWTLDPSPKFLTSLS